MKWQIKKRNSRKAEYQNSLKCSIGIKNIFTEYILLRVEK